MNEEVAITGFGAIGPGFENKEEFWDLLINKKKSLTPLENMGINDETIVCGQLNSDYEFHNELKLKAYPKVSRIAIIAALEALEQANIAPESLRGKRVGVIIGSAMAASLTFEKTIPILLNDPKKFTLTDFTGMYHHSVSLSVSTYLGAKGPTHTIASSCTSSIESIQLAKLLLLSHQVDLCIVGGAEATISKSMIRSFLRIRMLSKETNPLQAGVPFSQENKGFVISDAASVFVLERKKDAEFRKAEILGYPTNIYINNDGISLFQSDASGKDMQDCVENTLQNTIPTYINSQALGIKENDSIESKVHQNLFSDYLVPITTIKGHIGHSIGASGANQLAATLLSMKHNTIPPTLTNKSGYEKLPIPTEPVLCKIDSVAITSHGFGGSNACLLVKKA